MKSSFKDKDLVDHGKLYPDNNRQRHHKQSNRIDEAKGELVQIHLRTHCVRPRCWCRKKYKKAPGVFLPHQE